LTVNRSFPRIQTNRDVLILRTGSDEVLVVACDSAGGIGPKALDKVPASGKLVGKLTARVALMEILAVGASPICIATTLSVEPHPIGGLIIEGIEEELKGVGLSSIHRVFSSEKNIPVEQTGLGVTVLGVSRRGMLRVGCSRPGDFVVAVGMPCFGSEVVRNSKLQRIAETKDVLRLAEKGYVHEMIPAGSGGLLAEAEILARDSKLRLRLSQQREVDVLRSAGPATALVCSVAPSGCDDILSEFKKPVSEVGVLSN